jgi:hypothetical protein
MALRTSSIVVPHILPYLWITTPRSSEHRTVFLGLDMSLNQVFLVSLALECKEKVS